MKTLLIETHAFKASPKQLTENISDAGNLLVEGSVGIGTTNPTNPIIPDKDTLAPTAAAQDMITLYFNFFTSTPSL